ncbi:vacuolar protein sorting-associated protein 51 [Entomortierella parvispora]|uniref:Vacuolar protein sorting-associated protein 51 homolog n=1 Tax=Entomortierella parvispora TaxID=205924 RepID=A0A9P3M0P6_9FUNG|nr:vacuolar protein sorting-associated protein 51 [Entomortierella parvispora]
MAAGDGPLHPLEAPFTAPTTHQPAASSTTTTTAGLASGTTTRRRAKSFLRNYYGIQQADAALQEGAREKSSSHPGGAALTKADPYDLDSHAFEVDKYMHKMFVEKQLPGLVQSDNELVADIRQLDGDMKTLVYENYSKFLSATDTINKMKSNVDNLESEMSRLTENISKIATSSSAIHSSLGGKREKIRQLNGVHSLLTKLQFVFELPTNLHQCLETESYTQAVKSYCRTLHLLQHYKHLTVFTGIERECKTIMVQIAQKIRQKMRAEEASLTEISENVGLLLALKEDPVALWKQYLELSLNALRKVRTKTLQSIESLPLYIPPPAAGSPGSNAQTPVATPKKSSKKARTPSGGTKDKDKDGKGSKSASAPAPVPADKVSVLNAQFLKQVEIFVSSFRSYFLVTTPTASQSGVSGEAAPSEEKELVESSPDPASSAPSSTSPPAWIAKDVARVHASLTREQQALATKAIKEAISKIVSGYLDTIRSFLDYPDDIFSIQPEVHVHVLQTLYLGTISSTSLCQLSGFDSLATGLIQNWESRLVERSLAKVKDGLLKRILEPGNGDGGWTVSIRETAQWLLDVFKMDTVPFLERCMSSEAQFMETKEGRALFLKNFQDGFKLFWDQVLQEMQQLASASSSATSSLTASDKSTVETLAPGPAAAANNNSTRTSLVMSQLCFELSNATVEQLYRAVSKTLFRPGKRNRSGSFLIESYEEPPMVAQLQWDYKNVVQSCQETGHLLLDGFISRTGNELSWLVMDIQPSSTSLSPTSTERVSVDFLTLPSPPSGVSWAWEEVYRQLNEIERQVIAVYGDEGDRAGQHRDISSESARRESIFKPTANTTGGSGSHHDGSNTNTNNGKRNDSLTSFGSNTMNSRFFESSHQQRNLLLSNIDKLFSDRVEIFVRCQDLTRTGILFGIIKILLKAWAESVRTRTFGKGGFQQVQVDAEFAKVWLWRFATADERLMHSLLEETQQTAYRRCIDPVPLDSNTVESIIHSSER